MGAIGSTAAGLAVGAGEQLADEPAPHDLAVVGDERAVGVAGQPRDAGDGHDEQRIGQAEQDGEDDQRAQGGEVLGEPGGHTHQEIPGMSWMSRSMALMPMKGTMMPPPP